ncbi:39S ribosomal protein L18, mitochondrial [Ischnura elegans]|uniref:39S ribosomal protein L18, mitochondrial n=1 Tax=Ischnura elegans TaxID=197161 RepID=UPI001ED89483|nr:39S ribosomal protein L18, mitochondrial [Ischnura elegans]
MNSLLIPNARTIGRRLRLPCDGVRFSQASASESLGPNDVVSPVLVNRNPRSLEKIRVAYKPKGYHVDKPGRDFWHKLVLTHSGRHITARVVHYTGPTVLSASSKEWCIKKYLYRTNDVSAYVNVARVLSQRCLESGIIEMKTEYVDELPRTEKLSSFFNAMMENGISLTEPERFEGHKPWDMDRPEKPWEVLDD